MIYATPATRDLCAPMLDGAASIQLSDARHIDRLIFGLMHDLHAEVVVFDGFSAHADQAGLIEFAEAVRRRQRPGALRRVFLVHGEPSAQAALAAQLAARGFTCVAPPQGDRAELSRA